MEALAHIIKVQVGAGLFLMGDGFKNSGLLIGTIGTVIVGWLCTYQNHILTRMSRVIKAHSKMDNEPTMPETISYSFLYGPPALAKMHGVVMFLMKVFISLAQYGYCIVYISFVSNSLKKVVESYSGISIVIYWYILLTFPIILGLCLINSLKFLAPVSMAGMFFLWIGFGISFILCCIGLPPITERAFIVSPYRWPLFIGTAIFAFAGITLVIPLKNEMEHPEDFDSPFGVMNIGMVIITVMYVSLGFFAYWRFGEKIDGPVTVSFAESWLGNVVLLMVALGILVSYPIQFYIPMVLCFKDVSDKWGPFDHPLRVELILRTSLVIVTYVFAMVSSHVDLAVSFIGAFACTSLIFLFPAMADISLRLGVGGGDGIPDEIKMKKTLFRFIVDGISILFFIMGFVFGTYTAVLGVVKVLQEDITQSKK